METLANNKLIAEFMEYKQGNGTEKEPFVYINVPTWYGSTETKGLSWFRFNQNWNDLMPVVEKIYSLDKYYEYKIRLSAFDLELKDLFPNIEKVYEFCLEFIKWYNENK